MAHKQSAPFCIQSRVNPEFLDESVSAFSGLAGSAGLGVKLPNVCPTRKTGSEIALTRYVGSSVDSYGRDGMLLSIAP